MDIYSIMLSLCLLVPLSVEGTLPDYGEPIPPYVEEAIVEEIEEARETEYEYLGTYKLTAYCSCTKCCGKSDGITASGVKATANHTVACNSLDFGTRLLIDGEEYVVEDRGGMGNSTIDIYFDSHSDALDFGVKKNVEVYLVKN